MNIILKYKKELTNDYITIYKRYIILIIKVVKTKKKEIVIWKKASLNKTLISKRIK